jgi:hypothetical protein
VDDHRIRIKGSKDVLERAVLAGQAARLWHKADIPRCLPTCPLSGCGVKRT